MPRARKTRTARASAEPFWKIRLYIRLSKEDDNEDDSESIINQEAMTRLRPFSLAASDGWILIRAMTHAELDGLFEGLPRKLI